MNRNQSANRDASWHAPNDPLIVSGTHGIANHALGFLRQAWQAWQVRKARDLLPPERRIDASEQA